VLAIGANEATCLYVLPDIFADYQRLYPAVQISIYRNFSHKILEKIETGATDVGVVTLPVKAPSMKVYPIFRDRLMLVTGAQNPLARRSSVSIAEVAAQPLLFPRTGHTRQLLDKHFRPFRTALRVTMELPSVGMIKCFVAAGLGVSLISASFARDEIAAGTLRLVEIEDVEIWRELGLVYRRDRSLPRAATAFIGMLRQHATEARAATA
jgi:DNA-binding transcriptional LysR family regulator